MDHTIILYRQSEKNNGPRRGDKNTLIKSQRSKKLARK